MCNQDILGWDATLLRQLFEWHPTRIHVLYWVEENDVLYVAHIAIRTLLELDIKVFCEVFYEGLTCIVPGIFVHLAWVAEAHNNVRAFGWLLCSEGPLDFVDE